MKVMQLMNTKYIQNVKVDTRNLQPYVFEKIEAVKKSNFCGGIVLRFNNMPGVDCYV